MLADKQWKGLGWQHPMWEMLRYYLSLRHISPVKQRLLRDEWLSYLAETQTMSVGDALLKVDDDAITALVAYIHYRPELVENAFALLREEEEALDFCTTQGFSVAKTTTQLAGHHQSSKSLIAAVSSIATRVCEQKGVSLDPNPQRRCVWCTDQHLHVTARNLDGSIPSLANPWIIWEIKEYWGKTSGGSKMSDAVYECNLVGRELRDFEAQAGLKIDHIVFVDGKTQWKSRVSDLARFIDLLNQGLIDALFFGKEVESSWDPHLSTLLDKKLRDTAP